MAIQSRYDELFKLLSGDFRRNYAPHHAFADTVAMFQTLPGLIGLWSCGPMGASGLLNDLSGNGLQMTNNNAALFSAETSSLIPWIELNGTDEYFSRADTAILDISGAETYVATAVQGITIGGWFWFDVVTGTNAMMSKFTAGGQASYRIYRDTAQIRFYTSADGTNEDGVVSGDAPPLTANGWYFCVGRSPNGGAEQSVFVNGIESIGSAGGFPIFNSTAAFEIGRMNAGSYLNGRASMCFLCAAAVPTIHLTTLYQWTRCMYNR